MIGPPGTGKMMLARIQIPFPVLIRGDSLPRKGVWTEGVNRGCIRV